MNVGKQDLDALLKGWEPPRSDGDEGPRWEARADAIVKAALGAEAAPGEALDALLAAPPLAPEPGESGVVFLSGEKKMDQEDEPGDAAPKSAAPPPTTAPTERRRTSLKEFAARASQSGRPSTRPSSPGPRPSSPGPASDPGGKAASIAPPVASTSRPETVPPPRAQRPVEAGKDDSGVIDLAVVRASATAQQIAAAERAKPAQAGLFEDDKTVESPVSPTEQAALAKPAAHPHAQVAVVSGRKSRTGPIAGAAIAVLGIAAAVVILYRKAPLPAAPAPVAVVSHPAAPAPTTAVTAAPSSAPSSAPEATAAAATALSPGDLPPAAGDTRPAEPARGPLAAPAPTGATGATPNGGAAPPPSKDAVAAAATGKPGDLQSEMARAVGGSDPPKAGDPAPEPEPAAANGRNQNVPEQPSQGSVQSAVGAVIGSAKACVAGADDISRAQVTFSSTGAVSSVSVTGWAAAHGKSGCVQAALKGARVGPFSKPSFTVPVPIRP